MEHLATVTVTTFAAASAWRAIERYRAERRGRGVVRPSSRPALRVALFSGNYNCVCDGANKALNQLVRHLLEVEGAEVRIYSPTIDHPAFEPVGTIVPVPSVPIPGRREYRLALGLPREVAEDVRRFAPDILHLSAPDILGRQALDFARSLGIPVVTSLHTRFETYLDYYGLRWLQRPVERWLHNFYARSDRILVPTRAILEDMRAKGLGDRASIWGRGIDPAIFTQAHRDASWRRGHGYSDDEMIPLFFGRLVLEKGLKPFAETITLLRDKGHRLRPLIIGDGPARGWLAERLPNVVFTGHLKGKELGRAVASADILINPSLTEAFGNVTLEAMASGLAVICPDVGSTRELIASERTGLLIRMPEPHAYALGFERLFQDRQLCSRIRNAAAWEAHKHSWDRENARVVAAYREVLREPAASQIAR